jgi:hypothetical protein
VRRLWRIGATLLHQWHLSGRAWLQDRFHVRCLWWIRAGLLQRPHLSGGELLGWWIVRSMWWSRRSLLLPWELRAGLVLLSRPRTVCRKQFAVLTRLAEKTRRELIGLPAS